MICTAFLWTLARTPNRCARAFAYIFNMRYNITVMNRLSRDKQIKILQCLLEGNSTRGTARIVDVSTHTVENLLIEAGEACSKFHDKKVRNLRIKDWVEVDEMWTFVYAKEKNVAKAKNPPDFAGHSWTHTALDAKTKLLISYRIGKRDPRQTLWLLKDLRKRVEGRVPLASDGYPAYSEYSRSVFGDNVPLLNVVGTKKSVVSGSADILKANTTFVERHNRTMRMSMRRYSRKTDAHSKKIEYQRAHMHLYCTWYNWCRVHESLRCTPAMEAGLTEQMHDLNLVLDLIEARRKPPVRPKTYKKRTKAK